jgi:hypothetical protein
MPSRTVYGRTSRGGVDTADSAQRIRLNAVKKDGEYEAKGSDSLRFRSLEVNGRIVDALL